MQIKVTASTIILGEKGVNYRQTVDADASVINEVVEVVRRMLEGDGTGSNHIEIERLDLMPFSKIPMRMTRRIQ